MIKKNNDSLLFRFPLQNNKPLYSFEDNSDYVYDVMWSPTHPALFACVDGVGHLDLWNLNNDTEVWLAPRTHITAAISSFNVFIAWNGCRACFHSADCYSVVLLF